MNTAESPTSSSPGPEAILSEIIALPRPDFDRSRADDEAYVRSYTETTNATQARHAELALTFYRLYPDHTQAERLLTARWALVIGTDPARAQREIDEFLEDHPNGLISPEARDHLANLRTRLAKGDPAKLLSLAEDIARGEPRNESAATIFLSAAEAAEDKEKRGQLLRRIILDYPNSRGAIRAGGILRRAAQVGMPFYLGFHDARTGEWIHTANLRGKVVVVDFWATWCGPCVGQIPHLREVYARYKDRGLEILGVSLDGAERNTSLDTLRAFLAEHRVDWPQYYQGQGWDSSFSSSWGVNQIPDVFVVDQSGRLHSTDAAHDKLDPILAKLLPATD